ncbi:phosphatidylinositol N-acetylglucosaminyltransferase subunit C [Thraustotheca clavata]|uniref:Phosphatidylinositol N-acetylglucosaminyltransferase subunit C n=1 Tax=Thraustotheca clavata TaxID=74557 RepID=A0A1V9ZVC3_9STRA|nr:phosphatidylinositol N-acetylglucosaminyltransferase subunit C [Thraustotheca clavata]
MASRRQERRDECHVCGRATTGDKKIWRKILWEEQPYEDWYVDSSFLEQLRTNENVREYDYWGMTKSSAALTQQMSLVLIFFAIFVNSSKGVWSWHFLACIDIIVAFMGYGALQSCGDMEIDVLQMTKESLLFTATLSILSPVLRTLTESYAADSIWALSISLTGIHLISHDYTYINGTTYKYAGTIALNAAIFTSVLLASLLHSNEQVFSFVLFAIEVFAICPIVQHNIKKTSESMHLSLTMVLFTTALLLMWPIAPLVSVVVLVTAVFITFVCPLWLMHAQEYKNEIQGPWDIAQIEPQQ